MARGSSHSTGRVCGEEAMSLNWIHENPSRWDENKAAIVGGAPTGIFKPESHELGRLIGGEW